jgi:hypothetical protein
VTDRVGVRLHLLQPARRLQVRDERLARGEAFDAAVLAGVLVERAVRVHDRDDLQAVTLADLEVDRVMAGRHLQRARTGLNAHGGVADDRDQPAVRRHDRALADQAGVARILRVHGDRRVRGDRLRTRGGDDDVTPDGRAVHLRDRVAHVPERAGLVLVLHFDVGDRGTAVHAPVDEALGAVDQAVAVEVLERRADGLLTLLVHRERLAAPVRGGTQAPVLGGDAVAATAHELPGAVEELVPPDVVAADALARQVALDDRVHGDGGMVHAGQPERVVAKHAVPAHQRVLHGVREGVPHVQLTGEVGRRHDHREGARARAVRLEEAAALPPLVQRLLHRLRVIGRGHVLRVEVGGGGHSGFLGVLGQTKRPASAGRTAAGGALRGATRVAATVLLRLRIHGASRLRWYGAPEGGTSDRDETGAPRGD